MWKVDIYLHTRCRMSGPVALSCGEETHCRRLTPLPPETSSSLEIMTSTVQSVSKKNNCSRKRFLVCLCVNKANFKIGRQKQCRKNNARRLNIGMTRVRCGLWLRVDHFTGVGWGCGGTVLPTFAKVYFSEITQQKFYSNTIHGLFLTFSYEKENCFAWRKNHNHLRCPNVKWSAPYGFVPLLCVRTGPPNRPIPRDVGHA